MNIDFSKYFKNPATKILLLSARAFSYVCKSLLLITGYILHLFPLHDPDDGAGFMTYCHFLKSIIKIIFTACCCYWWISEEVLLKWPRCSSIFSRSRPSGRAKRAHRGSDQHVYFTLSLFFTSVIITVLMSWTLIYSLNKNCCCCFAAFLKSQQKAENTILFKRKQKTRIYTDRWIYILLLLSYFYYVVTIITQILHVSDFHSFQSVTLEKSSIFTFLCDQYYFGFVSS